MTSSTIKTGEIGESIAIAHLRKKGYIIIERNYRCVFGEVDIVARDGNDLVFIEVKSRRSDNFGTPAEAVDHRKQRKLSKIALQYLKEKKLDGQDARFDVVAVSIRPEGNSIELIENAFEYNY